MPKPKQDKENDPVTKCDLDESMGVIKKDISVMKNDFDDAMIVISNNFNRVDGRLDGIDGRLDGIDGRLDGIDGRLENLESDVGELKTAVGSLQRTTEAILSVVQSSEGRLQEMASHEERITRLENTVYPVR